MLTYLELFAGAGGLSLGLDRAGLECVAHAEIDLHARAVLRMQWPDVPVYGDVNYLDGHQFTGVDLVSGGSPCQDLSNAGKRAGLAGSRSSLFYDQVRVWHECRAPYFLWENVKGALTSNAGADFAAVLSAVVGSSVAVPRGGWRSGGVVAGRYAVAAWRVLDLQWFGPAQRRARVFVVAARPGAVDPAAVLAVSEDACGHVAPSENTGDADSRCAGEGARVVTPTLTIGAHPAAPGLNGMDAVQFASALLAAGSSNLRRLTPVECERLMGWPDGWTQVGVDEDGDTYDLLDTPRYVLCGNGVGSPCAEWVGRRLRELELTTGGVEDYL